ncbi:uncharacterized protein LOC115810460 [Chanos chanos]|uniref:Uncharacterized protein LOC115810460 n=1 Tax=Chanos chanos TaxID=29144 RepID=A0A6J2V8S8_CHACN|nr:uncharacterized protein LOC115810460 [Chanos chanos]
MADKSKIHVFMGAPSPQLLSKDGREDDSCPWKTQELTWKQGQLRIRENETETQASDLDEGDGTSAEQSNSTNEPVREAAHCKLDKPVCQEQRANSLTEEGEKEVHLDDTTHPGLTCFLKKRLYPEERDLSPEVVTEYLDSCFPVSHGGSDTTDPIGSGSKTSIALSVETDYLTTWTKSQALVLRGRMGKLPESGQHKSPSSLYTPPKQTSPTSTSSPELYSPTSSSGERGFGGTLRGSGEMFSDSLSQRQQEGGVILESTPDGILCSQDSSVTHTEVAVDQRDSDPLDVALPRTPEQTSHPTCALKKTKLALTTANSGRGIDQKGQTLLMPPCGPTTLLARCKTHGVRYSVLVAVVHPCHLKEIKVKSGALAGSAVPMATVIVTDQSGEEMKVVLWRAAAFWALTVYPGDVLLITGVTVNVDKWREETVLQSSYASRLLNLGQVTRDCGLQIPQNVNGRTFRELCSHLFEKWPLLASLPPRMPQDLGSVSFVGLRALRPDRLVHVLVRIKHINMITTWRDEAEGRSRAAGVLKALLTVEQDGQQGAVVLWGTALAWLQNINANKEAVWEFRLLLVRQDTTSGLVELHSTPWGSCKPLFPDDIRCREFYRITRPEKSSTSFEIDLHTLLSQKYSGDVELKVKITAFQFQGSPSQDAGHLMNGDTPLEKILNVVSGDITFTGCGRCCVELKTDENGIYKPCYPCLPHTAVRHYYRPVVLTVKEGDNQVCVQVPPVLVQRMLTNTPPDKLSKTVGPSSDMRFVQVIAERIHSMLSTRKSTFLLTVRSHFQCDENSIPIIQNFLLLDFKFGVDIAKRHQESLAKKSDKVSFSLSSDDSATYNMAGALRMDETQYSMKIFENELLMDIPSYPFMPQVDIKSEPFVLETAHGPYLQIIEEPKQRGFRFRYECEGPSHGGLPGASSERNRRTYPTVKVNNFVGHARVEVQLVTHTDPPRVHAHSLVGRQCNENGTCSVDVGPNDLTATFSNLGILHVTKRAVEEVLMKRLKEEKRRQREPGYHFSEAEEQTIALEAKELSKQMDLNIVRLKFTAYLQDSNGGFTRALKPVISNPIYDSKSPNASNLKISRMDKTCGSVAGGDEIFLLCDKVQKDDIEIRFYEENEDGVWEAFGDFSPTDVHKQYAIVFKTPAYHCQEIERPVTVFLQLKRKKGGDCSEPKQFTYVPNNQDKEEVQRKRMKSLPQTYDNWRGPQGGAGGLGRGAGGFGDAGGGTGGGMGGGYQFNHQMDGFYGGGCGGFGGGGTQMSGSTPQTGGVQQQQRPISTQAQASAQQQLLQIVATLQNRATAATKRTAEALLEYCSTGDVRPLIAMQRHLCGVQDENGDTPLHLAIIHQQPVVVQQLLHSIIRTPQMKIINKLNNLGQTPLHLAVITKQTKLVELLLRVGADPSLLDRDGRTVVHLAAHAGDDVMLRVLLNLLGERYAHLVNTADFSGLYPLHLAVRKGGERCLRLLVEAGAKINTPEQKSGCTALHLAVKEDLFKTACTLITELKADVNICTFGGNTPLHFAASQGSPPLCSMLIAAGANKLLENDEPLFLSSSSDEDDEEEQTEEETRQAPEDMAQQVEEMSISSETEPVNPRKRRAAGHTPFDLAKCQKVRDLLDGRRSPKPSQHTAKKSKKMSEEAGQQLDSETVSKLCGILSQGNVPWRDLAEKLGMLTLAHLYQESPSPCQNLLENYQLGGGPVEGLVEALQSLGLTEGVKLLRQRQPREDKQNIDSTVDSGFGSQVMEEDVENPALANH